MLKSRPESRLGISLSAREALDDLPLLERDVRAAIGRRDLRIGQARFGCGRLLDEAIEVGADPRGCVRAQAAGAIGVEAADRAHERDVAVLNELEEARVLVAVPGLIGSKVVWPASGQLPDLRVLLNQLLGEIIWVASMLLVRNM